MSTRYLKKLLIIVLCFTFGMQLTSCATDPGAGGLTSNNDEVPRQKSERVAGENNNGTSTYQIPQNPAGEVTAIEGDIEFIRNTGTDVFDVQGFRKLLQAEERPSGIVLNFEGADIKKVIALVIGKIMKQNYLIDPAVKGTVTLKTERPLNKDTVFYMLENLLDLYGARISKRKGHYRIFPKNKAGLSTLGFGDIDNRIKLGYGYRIVPLNYVSSAEMVKILESVTNKETIIRADEIRNLIIIGGTSENVRNMIHAIDMFDVDWMKDTNVGLIKVNHSNVGDILDDLRKMLTTPQSEIGAGGVLTLDSIDRLNSILVITRQYEYLQRIRSWVRKLDVPAQGAGSHLYVYNVKNATAAELADILNKLFSAGAGDSDSDAESKVGDFTGPGSVPVEITEAESDGEKPQQARVSSNQISSSTKAGGDFQIIAAEDTNALLISATPSQFAKIEQALEKLDSAPMQVLMEVTIMDVQLTDNFSYGMQWFLEHGDASSGGSAVLGDALNFAQTFSYSGVRASGDVRSLLGLLASEGKVDVLSSPSILVRNNRKASIRVGDQQPISTSSLNENGTVIATSVTFRDTGILLEIKPSISSSGTINVELTQEVIDVGDIDVATGQRTFLNRNLNTNVSVRNGETIVLGGLIRTNQAQSKSGVPGLRDIPIIGFLFGKTVTSEVRTELIIMLSPRIIRNLDESNQVLQEYKSKFRFLPL